MLVARLIGGLGRALMTAGVVLLLFVAYQLWGTGLAEAQAQSQLRADFEASLATAAPVDAPSTTGTTHETTVPAEPATGPGTGPRPEPVPEPVVAPTPTGEAIAIIRIPAIGVDKTVVEGVSVADLRKGPGHYPGTPLPGEAGNAAIAGHRTTYGAPFNRLDELAEGDDIVVITRSGEHRYVVDRISVVLPSAIEVLDPTEGARITLTTCNPKYSARQRLIVSGALVGEAAPPTQGPTVEAAPSPAPTTGAGTEDPSAERGPDDADDDPVVAEAGVTSAGLYGLPLTGDPSARGPAVGWGLATTAVALTAVVVGRRWRRWPSYLLAVPVGATTMFLCFEQVARLMPPSI